ALGWHGHGEVAVLVGTTPPVLDVDQLRRTARHLAADVLIGVQGNRLVLVIGRADERSGWTIAGREDAARQGEEPKAEVARVEGDAAEEQSRLSFLDIAQRLESGFGPGAVVLGHPVPDLVEASRSARAALAGFAVVRAWRRSPRPVLADDLLPERALAGDPLARSTLIGRIYRPLKDHSTSELLSTLWAYLDNGRSLEGTARELFVHPNTVRYRLKRITELIGYDATGPREALILHAALILGAISEPVPTRRRVGR
ncbi:MAG: PucR family transcriptional regulator, partial [Amnibacterium sp.]